MVQLAIELFVLVLATTFCGFAAGFLSGKLRYSLTSASVQQSSETGADAAEPADTRYEAEPARASAVARRIPDPAPPSESRRKRRISS